MTYKPTEISDNGTIVLRSSNIKNGKIDLTDLVRVNSTIRENQYVQENDILICARNGSKALVGKCALIKDLKEITSFGAFMAILRSSCYEYIYYFLNTQTFRKTFDNDDSKQINQLTQDMIKSTLIPLPPFQEQRRIVSYIEKTFCNVDDVELGKENLTALVSITKFKILDLAIRGKLVPQNKNDEPASALLERIKAEKEELIKQGKIKRDKKESVIFKGDDNSYYRSNTVGESCIEDFPFELPNGWEWCNLSMIGYTNIGLTYKPTDIVPDGTMVLRSSNIVNGKIDLTDLIRVNTNIRDNQYIEENDILICARNGSKALVGKCAIFKGISERTSFGAFMAVYRSEFYKYIYYFLNSQIFRDTFMNDDTKQINQLTQDMIKNTILALPPLEEQKRIVNVIETAFEYLDNILNNL